MATEHVGRACGKVILFGEHAVVYGVPAIAVGIDRGARATAVRAPAGPSSLFVRGWEIRVTEDAPHHDLARALRAVLGVVRDGRLAPSDGEGIHFVIEAEADLPPGGGLGCSAAIGVAVARAIDPDATDSRIAECAMAWEKVFHGNPSGIDAAVAASGGCMFFTKGSVATPVRVGGGLTLCVGGTGIASSTKSMVQTVARLRERRPTVVEKTFEGIRSLVLNARLAIEAGDRFALGRLMDLNQMLLSGLFVSSQEIERMCDLSRAAGAMGAKLTGAGGGGSVIALVPSGAVAEKVIEAWRGEGFHGFATKVAPVQSLRMSVSESAP